MWSITIVEIFISWFMLLTTSLCKYRFYHCHQSQVTRLYIQLIVTTTNEENIKAQQNWSFVSWIDQWPVDSPQRSSNVQISSDELATVAIFSLPCETLRIRTLVVLTIWWYIGDGNYVAHVYAGRIRENIMLKWSNDMEWDNIGLDRWRYKAI